MPITTTELIQAAIVGVGATITMDIWALAQRWLLNSSPPNYCLVGRWFCHMPAGTFRHPSIARAASRPGECLVGWLAHYWIGVVYAVTLVLLTNDWLSRPTLLPALATGLVTLVFPFLLMQPAFGLGLASARAPHPGQARMRSVLAHGAFALGLYLTATALSTFS